MGFFGSVRRVYAAELLPVLSDVGSAMSPEGVLVVLKLWYCV